MWVQIEATELIRLADSCRGKSNEEVQAVRLMVDTRKWLFAKALPRVYGDHLSMDVQADVEVRQVDQMTMLEKARAIQYALKKAAELQKPVPALPSEKQVNPAPLTTAVDHQATVARLLSPTPRPAPEVHDPDEDEVLL
jgi:hypothetical protein